MKGTEAHHHKLQSGIIKTLLRVKQFQSRFLMNNLSKALVSFYKVSKALKDFEFRLLLSC